MSALSGWQPIETAPKDGTLILVSGLNWRKGPKRHYAAAKWDTEGGEWQDADDPSQVLTYLTHWMRCEDLPPPEPHP